LGEHLELEEFLKKLCSFGIEVACIAVDTGLESFIATLFETAMLVREYFCPCIEDTSCLLAMIEMNVSIASLVREGRYVFPSIKRVHVDIVKSSTQCWEEAYVGY